jgi:polyisoprenoid-binding protein YceI
MTTAATATEAPALTAGRYALDFVHSTVGFEVKHMISTFRGSFRVYGASLESRDGHAALRGSAEVASVDVRDENLAAHLRSPEFFDAEGHPQIAFGSDRLDLGDDGDVRLEGELTVKGITRPITATGRYQRIEADMGGGERLGLELETTVDRREFEMNWNAALPKGGLALGNDVKLVVHLELVPEEA